MMKLAKAAEILQGTLTGEDVEFFSVSHDTRTLEPGALFVAIKGEQFDGHDYIDFAMKQGAVAAIVDKTVKTAMPVIHVENTQQALQELATYWRGQFHFPVVAITGSCGKTTVRAMLSAILQQEGPTLASIKSFNNHIGVPLTLLNMREHHKYCVVEMGMNHAGELADMTQWVRPDVALITCIAPVHLEALKTLENVAKAKAEIFQGLGEDGIAIVNADDDFADFLKQKAPGAVKTFGIHQAADMTAKAIQLDDKGRASFLLCGHNDEVRVQLPLSGAHHVMNALAAALVASTQSVPFSSIAKGLAKFELPARRMSWQKGHNGALVIDDSYNASPTAVDAAIDVLSGLPGKKCLVFADMLELGESSPDFHTAVGLMAKAKGVECFFTYGKLASLSAKAFGSTAQHFEEKTELVKALKAVLDSDTVVLIKGSNGMKLNTVVAAITEQ